MAIDRVFLGQKVARYRKHLLADIENVSGSTGIDEGRLRAIEAGQIEPSGDEVLILADYFGCDFRFFISNDRVAPFERTEELYRAYGGEFTHRDRIAIKEFLYLCETEAFLQTEMGREFNEFRFASQGGMHKVQGEQAAAQLRVALGLSDEAVPEDVYGLFRRLGVHVFRRKLENSKISGLFVLYEQAGRCALVNFVEDVYRQRFSATHEMAHAIFDSEESQTSVSYERSEGFDLVEIRANRFASCFLMPPARLRQLPSPAKWNDHEVRNWAQHFRVSCHALSVALSESNVIDEETSRRFRQLRVPRDIKVDPELPTDLNPSQRARKLNLLERGLSDDYVGLCFDALHLGKITVDRLAEAMLCSSHQLGELAALYGRSLHGH